MTSHLFPSGDHEFETVMNNLNALVQKDGTKKGLTPEDVAAFAAFVQAFKTDYGKHKDSTRIAREESELKEASRKACQKDASRIMALMGPRLSNAERVLLEMPAKLETRTRRAIPTAHVRITASNPAPLEIALQLRDNDKPKSSGKPAGVDYAEVWMKVGGEMPSGWDESFLLLKPVTDVKSLFRRGFRAEDRGKAVYWVSRWANVHGEGPWSAVVMATVA